MPSRLNAYAERAGGLVQRRLVRAPWSNVYGTGRTLVALGTLGVLAGNDPHRLLVDHTAAGSARSCSGISTLSLFCHTSSGSVQWARVLAIAVLVAAASGWRPRWWCIPHWWITFSVATSVVVEDGGDQVATILTLLLIPVALLDARRWVWSAPPARTSDMHRLIAFAATMAIRMQVAMIYFQAFTAKLYVTQWVNGTAVYYYLKNPVVGSPGWQSSILAPILHNAVGVRAFTYATLAIELLLFLCLFLPRRITHRVLYLGIALHLAFAVMMGLPSFTIIMWGALVLDLRDWSSPFRRPWAAKPAAVAPARAAWPWRRRVQVAE